MLVALLIMNYFVSLPRILSNYIKKNEKTNYFAMLPEFGDQP